MRSLLIGLGALAIASLAASCRAETPPDVIALAPAAASPAHPEGTLPSPGGRILHNITQPSLTVFPAPAGAANGAAVIIAPGGGFHILSFDNEGIAVAQWLAARGVTAFVLKYRLNETPADPVGTTVTLMKYLQSMKGAPDGLPPATLGETQATADALAAMTLVRARAHDWGLDPHKIGFLGFSAGAMLALNVVTRGEPGTRPDFVGVIYGALRPTAIVPADAPPAFIAAAADDPLLPGNAAPIYEAWKKAGRPAELHLYDKGGHGFGMKPQGADSDHWIDEFAWWLEEKGFLARRKQRKICP